MNIEIRHLIDGAKQARGLTVIIDVFRAFSTEAYIINNHAKLLIPVKTIEEAFEYKKKYNNAILVGERHGKIIEGFDYGNSPSQVETIDFTDKVVIHTTSAGTQGVAYAKDADEIITGSLVNAKAIATYIKQRNPEEVSLVCMGLEGLEDTDEDILCAKYIKALVEDKDIDITQDIENLKNTSGAKFFDNAQKDVFPMDDFFLSTKCNIFNFVLKINKNNEIERINV